MAAARRTFTWWAALAGAVLVASSAGAGGYAAAFLETGLGVRGAGMGDALAAVVDDPSAPCWNPAGLTRARSRDALASVQSLSLGRRQSGLAFALNLRRELAFGVAWQHAGVDGLVGRTAAGAPTGAIGDAEDAVWVSAARAVGRRVSLGVSMVVLRQRLDVPGVSESGSDGHGFDLGLQAELPGQMSAALVVRHLDARLNWKVSRAAQQISDTSDPLPTTLVLAAARRLPAGLVVAADAQFSDLERHLDVGGEWRASPLLTLRAGCRRLLAEDGRLGNATLGLSVRPMRRELLEFHAAYAADPLGAGARSLAAIGFRF
jgi:hypothetical protein